MTSSSTGNRAALGSDVLSGKVYFEVVSTATVRVGICNDTVTATGTQTNGQNIVYWQGFVINNGANTNIGGGFGDTDVVQVAVDVDTSLIWMRKNGGGLWNGNSAADPTALIGGIDISSITGQSIYTYVRLQPGGGAILNGSADRFAHPAPSGFTQVL